jgi:hypothetical protein
MRQAGKIRGEPRDAARRAAKRAVAHAWYATGWSRRPSRGVDYEPLRTALGRYVELTFDTPPELTKDIVDAALRSYLAPMHARRIHIGLLSDNGLIGEAHDQALRLTQRSGTVNEFDGEYAHGFTRSSAADDARLTEALFNARPEAVRKAMAQLSSEGLKLDYVIMTEYLDSKTPLLGDRVRQVTQTLRRQKLLIHKEIRYDTVRNVVSRFGRRVQGVG